MCQGILKFSLFIGIIDITIIQEGNNYKLGDE